MSVMRGRFPGATTFGLSESMSADCNRWPIKTPVSPATTAGSQAPRFDTQHYVSSFDNHEFLAGSLSLESRIDEKIIAELKALGHKVKVQSAWGSGSAPTVIVYDSQTGVSSAGADPRRGRYAVAW